MERQMHQGSDRRALIIYIGAVVVVGLLIVLGAAVSWNSSGRSGEQAQSSRETNHGWRDSETIDEASRARA